MKPKLYKLAKGKKLSQISNLYGRVPHGIDLTELTFARASYPAGVKRGEAVFKCQQFEWVFVAELSEFTLI